MEYALQLPCVDDSLRDARAACPASWTSLLPEGPTVALYFGSEFCEDRLPDAIEAIAFCDLAVDHGCEPTLATPLVTDNGLRAVDRLLGTLAINGREPAVVFNDWGVLAMLRERHPTLARRAGRLMNRSLRDPRGYRDAPCGAATHDTSRYARTRRLLAGLGVDALESDADLEGGWLGATDDGEPGAFAYALHVPFTYAASGRACALKTALYADGDGFAKALSDRCPAPCHGKPMPVSRPDTALPHWRAGNTLLYEVPVEAARGFVSRADRIVVHASAAP
jgi:hypothetical protein